MLLPDFSFSQDLRWNQLILKNEVILKSLETDTIGFVWGIADDGLYQYEGDDVSKKLNIDWSDDDKLQTFTRDKYQNFIVGSQSGKVIRFNPYFNSISQLIDSKFSTAITSIACNDLSKSCAIVSYGYGIQWTSDEIDTLLSTNNILISNEVYAVRLEENSLILATDQGIQIIHRNNDHLQSRVLNDKDGLGDIIITNLESTDTHFWASNFDSEIYKINKSDHRVTILKLPEVGKVNSIHLVNNDAFYVGTVKGMFTYENDAWHSHHPFTTSSDVSSLIVDEEKNIWAATSGNMLSFAHLGFKDHKTTIERPQAILKKEDVFWLGSSTGLYKIQGNEKKRVLSNNVTCLVNYEKYILAGTYSNGLLILTEEGETLQKIDGWENTPNQSVLYVYPTQDFIYISSLTGIVKIKLEKRGEVFYTSTYENLNSKLGTGYIYQILEADGLLYFATDKQGVKILGSDSLRHFTHFSDGQAIGSVFSMTKCNAGNIWFSTSTGHVGFIDKDTLFQIQNERSSNSPYTSLITSTNQNIVMVRNSSIDTYNPEIEHFFYYNLSNSGTKELYLNCYSKDGENIYVAQENSILEISAFKNQKIIPRCIINDVRVNLTDVQGRTTFKESENNLEIQYSSAWNTAPEALTYQYKLDGLENKWRTTRDKKAVYPLLRPGKYIFRVRSSNDGLFSNQQEATYTFSIARAYYKTWWFIMLCAAVILLLFLKWRNERKKSKEQKEALIKKRIEAQLISLQTQLNPHFLFNSFNTLIGLIEENPKMGIAFTEKLTDFYRSILEFGKKDLISLKEEIELLQTYIHLMKQRFGNQIKIDLSFHDVESYQIPPLTLQLLVENALKHNIASTRYPLNVRIIQNSSTLTVTNKIVHKLNKSKGTGIGLQNIIKRHTLNNLKPPRIEKTDGHFLVTLYLKSIKT